jgi:uncharacterized protein
MIGSTGRNPIASPYAIDGRGRTADTTLDRHILDLIEAVVLTGPGERVMRPTFGSGVLGLVFAPNSDELAATTQFLVAGALQTWLGELIEVGQVTVSADFATLRIVVEYADRATGANRTTVVERSV